ncbi:MAG: MBL fold metallo-hydrolase [Clostridia bacterium]|nr:MBL fold metallo-hydrolase [Clostridia bacterium]
MEKLIQYGTKASLFDGPFGNGAPWHAAGMGYVIVTEQKHLIVIDGGHPQDAEEILALLEANANGVPVVDLWIITHHHGDHMGALQRICETPALLARVKIEKLVWRYPEEFLDANGVAVNVQGNRTMYALAALADAEVLHPELDQKLTVDGMELHFLYYTYDCRIVNRTANCNVCSLVFTVQGKQKKVMFTGDAYTRNLQVVVWLYRKQLKCDILQMPHHALCDTGLLDFYKEVDAKTVLIPTCIAGDRAMHSDQYAGNAKRGWNLWAEENADTVYKTFEGTVEIEL